MLPGRQSPRRHSHLAQLRTRPSEVIALVVLWRVRYKLSLRDLPELFGTVNLIGFGRDEACRTAWAN